MSLPPNHRRTTNDRMVLVASTLIAITAGLSLGCRSFPQYAKPTIEQLYHEAVSSSVNNAERTFLPEQNIIVGESPLPIADQNATEDLPPPVDTSKPVSAEFVETDLREAIQELADTAETEIVIDDRVRGAANVSINELPFERALEKLLVPQGLVYAKRGDRYYVGHADPESPLAIYLADHFEYIPRHHTPEDLMPAIPERLKRFTRVLEKAGTIAIDAPQPYAGAILMRLKESDRPVPQAVLEALVCVISPQKGFRFGFDWNHAYQVDGKDAFSLGVNSLGISSKLSRNGLQNAFDDFAVTSAYVKLLAEHGYLAIRASPRVMAKDGEKANISINRETFFSTQPLSNTGDAANAIFFSQNIQKVDSGISLEITPVIRGDNVTVKIEKAEVSEDVRTALADTNGNPYPVINRRSVSTTVHVRDGRTIVIGGLMQRQAVDRTQFIPGLAHIPLAGKLFQSMQHQDQEVEVVIFISPKIVRPAEDLQPHEIAVRNDSHVTR